jgi:hypothetical protein
MGGQGTDEVSNSPMQTQTVSSPKRSRKKTEKRTSKKRSKKKKTMAERADRHVLYEQAVQDPKADVTTLAKLYKKIRKKPALAFREDFCGTATLSTEWIKGGKQRTAYGVDLDRPTLDWGQQHNLGPLSDADRKRIELFEGNVLTARGPRADLVAALNFSYCCLKERKQLLAYFKNTHKNMAEDGLFFLDVLGGSETMGTDENRHDLDGFTYRWKQHHFDPRTHDMRCSIAFYFSDGSKIAPAFEYDWRLWTMPELCDLLDEAGFSRTHRLWEKTDKKGNGTGNFSEPKRVENQESWWTYLVAER